MDKIQDSTKPTLISKNLLINSQHLKTCIPAEAVDYSDNEIMALAFTCSAIQARTLQKTF